MPGPYGLSCPSAPVRGGCLIKMYAHILSFIEGPSQKWKHCANVSSTYHSEYVHAKCISINLQGNKKRDFTLCHLKSASVYGRNSFKMKWCGLASHTVCKDKVNRAAEHKYEAWRHHCEPFYCDFARLCLGGWHRTLLQECTAIACPWSWEG